MKILNFSKTQLRVATHLTVMGYFADRIKQLSVSHAKWTALRDAFLTALAKEDGDYKQQTGSDLTARITEADNKRDRAWGSIATVAAMFGRGVGSEAQTAMAEKLQRVVSTYNINVAAQLDQETGMLNQAISDLEKKQIDFALFGIQTVFDELKAANAEVARLLNERDEERSNNVAGLVKADRLVTDAAYDAVIAHLNAHLELNPTSELETLARVWNSTLNRIRVQILGTASQSSDGTVDIDVEEPSDTDPEQPTDQGNGQQPSGGVTEF